MLLVGGCGPTSFIDGKLDMAPTPVSKEEVVIWHTYGEEETRIFEKIIIPEFEKQHPDIVITPVRQPYDEKLKTTLIARASSEEIPDVVRMDIVWVPEFSRLGLLYPVSEFKDFEQVKSKL